MICYVMPFPGVGGTELQTLRVAQVAKSLHLGVVVFYPKEVTVVRDLFADHGFDTEPYTQVQPSLHSPIPFLRESARIARSLHERGVRVVHCGDILGAYFAGLGARMAGARVLSHVRNSYRSLSRREQIALRTVQEFVYVSKATREALDLPEPRKHGRVIYDVPGAIFATSRSRDEARQHFGLSNRVPVVGVAARIAPQKDYPTLIRAAKIVEQSVPEVRFLVAADMSGSANSESVQEVQELLDATNTRHLFHFAGFQEDMSWFFGAIDCLALSSHAEGLATVLLEAMQHGRTVVATDVDGNSEAVIDEQNGLLSRPGDPSHLASQIVRLLTEPDLVRRLKEGTAERLNRNFGEDRFVHQLAELYASNGLEPK